MLTLGQAAACNFLADGLNAKKEALKVRRKLRNSAQLNLAERGRFNIDESKGRSEQAVHIRRNGHERLLELGDSLGSRSTVDEDV